MTHSLSTTAADRPPAMYRSATLAMVVSSTSMNVGMTTATATTHGLIAGPTAARGEGIATVVTERSRLDCRPSVIAVVTPSVHESLAEGRWSAGCPLAEPADSPAACQRAAQT